MCAMLSDCGMLTRRTSEEILFQFIVIQCRWQLNTDLCCYLSKLSVALGKEWTNLYIPCPAALVIWAISVSELEEVGYASLSLYNYRIVVPNIGKS